MAVDHDPAQDHATCEVISFAAVLCRRTATNFDMIKSYENGKIFRNRTSNPGAVTDLGVSFSMFAVHIQTVRRRAIKFGMITYLRM